MYHASSYASQCKVPAFAVLFAVVTETNVQCDVPDLTTDYA